jgi:hypothetical protein
MRWAGCRRCRWAGMGAATICERTRAPPSCFAPLSSIWPCFPQGPQILWPSCMTCALPQHSQATGARLLTHPLSPGAAPHLRRCTGQRAGPCHGPGHPPASRGIRRRSPGRSCGPPTSQGGGRVRHNSRRADQPDSDAMWRGVAGQRQHKWCSRSASDRCAADSGEPSGCCLRSAAGFNTGRRQAQVGGCRAPSTPIAAGSDKRKAAGWRRSGRACGVRPRLQCLAVGAGGCRLAHPVAPRGVSRHQQLCKSSDQPLEQQRIKYSGCRALLLPPPRHQQGQQYSQQQYSQLLCYLSRRRHRGCCPQPQLQQRGAAA